MTETNQEATLQDFIAAAKAKRESTTRQPWSREAIAHLKKSTHYTELELMFLGKSIVDKYGNIRHTK
jgi:hypothetical protein